MIAEARKAGVFTHPGNVGGAREALTSKGLSANLPARLRMWSGEIIDQTHRPGAQSRKQIDLALVRDDVPVFELSGSTAVMPCEAVFATIEVKSMLNKQHLEASLLAIQELRSLSRAPSLMLHDGGAINRMLHYIVAFDSPALSTVKANILELAEREAWPLEDLFDGCIVLGKGVIMRATPGVICPGEGHNWCYATIEHPDENLFWLMWSLYRFSAGFVAAPPQLSGYFENRLNLEDGRPSEVWPVAVTNTTTEQV